MDNVMPRPNIILVMVDQLMPHLTGAYGHDVVQTPNMNRLARQGVRFDAAYSPCPLCSPARASMMTGQFASRVRCVDNASPLACDEPTFAHYLSYAGYDTVLSGKMHFVGPDQLHGFQTRLTTDIYPSGFKWVTDRAKVGEPMFPDYPHALMYATPKVGVAKWSMYLDYDEEIHFRALQFIRSRRVTKGDANEDTRTPGNSSPIRQGPAGAAPFFLCVSYHHPHEPFVVTPELWNRYDGARIDIPRIPANVQETYSVQDKWLNAFHGVDLVPHLLSSESLYALRRAYYGLVSYVDDKLGELMKTVEDAGLSENTVFIFTSDHGDMLCEKGMVQKRTFYEWSARIPLIVAFPDGRGKGTTRSQPVSLMDLAPTILDIAGVSQNDRLPMDGRSLMGLIEGTDRSERLAFSEYHSEGVYAPCFMVRRGRYKFNYVHGHDVQLFDMQDDPNEWHNLAGQPKYHDVEAELKRCILERFDPDAIEADIRQALPKRQFLKTVMQKDGIQWDFQPFFDATKQGVR